MLLEVIDENGTKKFRQLSGTTSDGIPLGSYVSVEGNAVPDGFLECDGSTFDAAVYPALAMLLGSNTLPERFDHSKLDDFEAITLATVQSGTPQNPTEMEYDGVLSVSLYSVTLAPSNIYVNGTAIPAAGVNGTGVTTATEIPVNKGDLVYVDNIYGQNNVRSSFVRYYKKHMLIKAVPGHVEDTTGLFNQIKDYSVSKAEFKAVVAASSDFADFQSLVEAM